MSRRGLTLVELLLAMTIMSIIMLAAGATFNGALGVQTYVERQTNLRQDATLVMQRIRSGLELTTNLTTPNGQTPTRNLLVFSANVNDDNDYYAGDTLFPRFDEDTSADMNNDGGSGSGGGLLTNLLGGLLGGGSSSTGDDDSDGSENEDWIDGIDNDADGNVDEDAPADNNNDDKPGARTLDDDYDGTVDDSVVGDDDEDGATSEDPINLIAYEHDTNSRSLTERRTDGTSTKVLANNVTAFSVTYQPPTSSYRPRLVVTATFISSVGETLTLTDTIYLRNLIQTEGRRVL